MRKNNTAINIAAYNKNFAKEMAKHNNPECPEEDNSYVNVMPALQKRVSSGIQLYPSKASIMARAAYYRAVIDQINNLHLRDS